MIMPPRRLSAAFAALGCLWLTVCTTQSTTATGWVKAGADDQTVAREQNDCSAQANAALASEQGINADINATLGRDWQLGGTQGIERNRCASRRPATPTRSSTIACAPRDSPSRADQGQPQGPQSHASWFMIAVIWASFASCCWKTSCR